MTYSLALLKAAHKSATVYVTVRQGADTFHGHIVGIGSKLGIMSNGELIEDVPVDRVVWADVHPHTSIMDNYATALRTVPGAFVDALLRHGEKISGAFSIRAAFPNGYTVSVVRNDMSRGGEDLALLYAGRVLHDGAVPEGTDIPPWNDVRLGGPEDAARIARQVAALPARA